MSVDEEKCEEFGVDPKAVASIARRPEKAATDAVANCGQNFDGGDGGDEW